MKPSAIMNHLFCFGFGFSAEALAKKLDRTQWRITGTSRSEAGVARIRSMGFDAVRFDGSERMSLEGVTHLVTSVPPDESGDPVLHSCRGEIARNAKKIHWTAYLSTTGVYGDRGGDWVDESSPLAPSTTRGKRRLEAERAWLSLLPVHVFRLAGIYGPGRNALESVREGTAKRIVKPGQVFSRIHVDDIAGVLLASMAKPNPGAAYNVCDDEPCPPQDVIAYAAALLGVPPPPEIAFEDAKLSPMAASFYAESKRVSNAKIKEELGYRLIYPNYRAGLKALLR
ncbi:MAG: SDR family oxidoreductase [Aestuariivirga sp.]